jgi:hypothetical protein
MEVEGVFRVPGNKERVRCSSLSINQHALATNVQGAGQQGAGAVLFVLEQITALDDVIGSHDCWLVGLLACWLAGLLA